MVDSDNQPEVVSANVEHGKHLLSHRNTVGGRISLTNLLEAFPFGGFGVPIPGIQGSTDPAVLLFRLQQLLAADNVQSSGPFQLGALWFTPRPQT